MKIDHQVYIATPPPRVFETLTSAKGWKAWFLHDCALDPRVGGKIRLVWKNFGPDHVSAKDHGVITEYQLPARFAFTWEPGGNQTTVQFDLQPRGTGTVLKLTDTGYVTRTKENLEVFQGCCVGWGEAMTLLKFYLEHGTTYGAVPKK